MRARSRIALRRRNKVKHVKTHFRAPTRYLESDGRFNYAIPSGKRNSVLIVRNPWRNGALTTRIKAATRGLDDGGDRVADYAKDFHNIRRLKFSHNIRPRAAARQWEKEERGRTRSSRRRARRKTSQGRGMRRSGRLGIGLSASCLF